MARESVQKADNTGQYGKVYVSYTLTSNPNIPNSGTWIGYGRGISPDGVLARGDLMGVWTMDGTKINIKSVDSVTDVTRSAGKSVGAAAGATGAVAKGVGKAVWDGSGAVFGPGAQAIGAFGEAVLS